MFPLGIVMDEDREFDGETGVDDEGDGPFASRSFADDVGVVAGDGRLDESEIAALATRLGKRLNDKELKAAMEEMDDDGDGTVDCGEFEKWWTAVGPAPWSSSVRSWHLLRRVAALGPRRASSCCARPRPRACGRWRARSRR